MLDFTFNYTVGATRRANLRYTVATNASGYGFGSSSQAQPYLNICKSMKPLRFGIGSPNDIAYEKIKADGYTDADGYVTQMHPDATQGLWAGWSWIGEGWAPIAGRYKFTYDGDQIAGTLGSGMSVVSNTPGELVFDFSVSGGSIGWYWNTITIGDHPRNFVCVREDRQALYDAGEIFNPDFIASLDGLCQYRHLNTMNTNGSTLARVSDFPLESNHRWSPIPLSIIAKLANRTGIDPWICMPHRAMMIGAPGVVDTTFATEVCTYFKAALDPDLMLIVQNSNETWGFNFPQYGEVYNEATHRGWSVTNNPNGYWAMADVVLAQACKAVYGSEAPTRLHYTGGSQAYNTGVTTEFAEARLWKSEEPENWIDPATMLDDISIAPYFGSSFIAAPGEITNLKARVDAGDTEQELITYIDGRIKALGYIPSAINAIQASKVAAGTIPLKQYEGGNHTQHWYAVQGVSFSDYLACLDALTAYSYSPEIAVRYGQVFDAWALVGDGPHMEYNHIGQASIFGAFNMAQSLDDFDNPRASYLINRSKTEAQWWSDPRRA